MIHSPIGVVRASDNASLKRIRIAIGGAASILLLGFDQRRSMGSGVLIDRAVLRYIYRSAFDCDGCFPHSLGNNLDSVLPWSCRVRR
jgi:hypothetical protein